LSETPAFLSASVSPDESVYFPGCLIDDRNDSLDADADLDEFPDSGVVKQRLTIGCERRDGRQSGDFACGHRNPFGLRRARAGPSVILSRMRIGGKVNDR
jgi:hypothetical protein